MDFGPTPRLYRYSVISLINWRVALVTAVLASLEPVDEWGPDPRGAEMPIVEDDSDIDDD